MMLCSEHTGEEGLHSATHTWQSLLSLLLRILPWKKPVEGNGQECTLM
jgi:hypothetical protein